MLDPTFGTGGKLFLPMGASQPTIEPSMFVAVQPDGKVIVAGSVLSTPDQLGISVSSPSTRTNLHRYTADGKLDTTFGSSGEVSFSVGGVFNSERPGALTVQPDGTIIVVGRGSLLTTLQRGTTLVNYVTLARLTKDGTLTHSRTFTNDKNPLTGTLASSVAVQADGRIGIVYTEFTDVRMSTPATSPSKNAFLVARFLADLSLDPTFDSDGKATISFPVNSFNDSVGSSLAIQSDGRFLLAGGAQTNLVPSPTGDRPVFNFAAARLNTDGSLDTTFGNGGRVIASAANDPTVSSSANNIQAMGDGSILLSGIGEVLRLTSNGELDPTYGNGGIVTISGDLLGATSSGEVLYVDTTSSTSERRIADKLARLTADGEYDSRYSNIKLDPNLNFGNGTVGVISPNGAALLFGFDNSDPTFRNRCWFASRETVQPLPCHPEQFSSEAHAMGTLESFSRRMANSTPAPLRQSSRIPPSPFARPLPMSMAMAYSI
jgi:uncharacterized delta-60 repeat protein